MRTLPAQLTTAMDSGSYTPCFSVRIFNSLNEVVLYQGQPFSFQIGALSAVVRIQTDSFLSTSNSAIRLRLTRGVIVAGVEYTISSSDYYVLNNSWDGNFQTFHCHLFPRAWYSAQGDLTYHQVIDAFCAYFGRTATLANPTAAYWDYQFFPTGKDITIKSAHYLFVLLRQKYLIFAVDNGGNDVLFYAAFDPPATGNYDISIYDYRLTWDNLARHQYIYRDESGVLHQSASNFSDMGQLGAAEYIMSLININNSALILAGTYTAGAGHNPGAIYYSLDQGSSWVLAASLTDSVYAFVQLYTGEIFAFTDDPAGSYYSSQDGITWALKGSLGHPVYCAIVAPSLSFAWPPPSNNQERIIVGCDGSLYQSIDGGVSFSLLKSFAGETFVWSVSYLGSSVLLAGTEAAGKVWRSADNGATWDAGTHLVGIDQRVLRIVSCGAGRAVLGGDTVGNTAPFWTEDYGLTWTKVAVPLKVGESFLYALVYAGNGVLLAGTYPNAYVFRSVDGGETWTELQRLGTQSVVRCFCVLDADISIAGTGSTAKVFASYNSAIVTAPFHNLGFLPSTAVEPWVYFHPLPPKIEPIPVHLKYQTGDSCTFSLEPAGTHFVVRVLQVLEEFDPSRKFLSWNMRVTLLDWLASTEGGDMPVDVENTAPYTPLNTGHFTRNLSAADTNVQQAFETLDNHLHNNLVAARIPTDGIAAGAVTYPKIQDVSATDKILGRASAGAGSVEEIACTSAARALLDDADAATERITLGLGTIAVKNLADYLAADANNQVNVGKYVGIADDAAYSFTPPADWGMLVVFIPGSSATMTSFTFIGYFRCSSPGILAIQKGSLTDAVTGALTGTTGTDTHLTVSVHTDGKIYVENRTGALKYPVIKVL